MPHFLIIYYQFQLKSRVSLNPSIFIMELTVDALYYQLLAAGAIVIFFVLYSYLPIFWYFGVLNIFTAAMYGLDKISAQFGWWRVSEESLLLLGVLGGWPFAIIAQQVFSHKLKKQPFQTWFICTIAINILLMTIFDRLRA